MVIVIICVLTVRLRWSWTNRLPKRVPRETLNLDKGWPKENENDDYGCSLKFSRKADLSLKVESERWSVSKGNHTVKESNPTATNRLYKKLISEWIDKKSSLLKLLNVRSTDTQPWRLASRRLTTTVWITKSFIPNLEVWKSTKSNSNLI